MIRILVIALLLTVSGAANAATKYCGPSAAGNGSGSDFSNLAALPNNADFDRANTTLVITEGSYGSLNLSEPTSGGAVITIRLASAADSAVTGYATTLYDSAATFTGIILATGDWIVDG